MMNSSQPIDSLRYPFAPTIEHPFFNISLWDLFNEAATKITKGNFIPKDFYFIIGDVPMSELKIVLFTITLYYLIIFGGRELLRNRKVFKLNFIFQIHNIFLTLSSLLLLLLLVEQLSPIIFQHGIFYAICNVRAWTQPIMTIYYLNYLLKYVELIDTFFLVLKHKKLTFLHTYHHGATALLCFTELVGKTAVSWVPITLNLAVHVVMYSYYFLAARGIHVWWKQWVTRLQILQFILDLCFIYFTSYHKTVHFFQLKLPSCGDCFGSLTATYAGCAILTSYLFLFSALYIELYRKKEQTPKSKISEKKISLKPNA